MFSTKKALFRWVLIICLHLKTFYPRDSSYRVFIPRYLWGVKWRQAFRNRCNRIFSELVLILSTSCSNHILNICTSYLGKQNWQVQKSHGTNIIVVQIWQYYTTNGTCWSSGTAFDCTAWEVHSSNPTLATALIESIKAVTGLCEFLRAQEMNLRGVNWYPERVASV